MNIFALYVFILSMNLFIFLSFLSRAATRPEKLAEEIDKITRIAEKSLYRGSRKKREIVSTQISLLRKRMFIISLVSAIIPVIGMIFLFTLLVVSYGEFSMLTRSSCALPVPFEIEYEGNCYMYTPWIIFFSYLVILPLYNYFSGLDLLRKKSD